MAKALTESRRTRYTRTVIEDSLIDLLREKPLNAITVSELCAKADVNRSTFYAHYDDLTDLLGTIENETFSWLSATFDDMLEQAERQGARHDGPERQKAIDAGLDNAIVQICRYIAQNRRHLQVLLSPRADVDFQRRLVGLIYARYDRIVATSPSSPSALENVMRTQFAIHGSLGLIQYWLETDLQATPEDIARTIITMSMPRETTADA
ncbi:AcrR family transcriptional regulator [Bifidobacterium castoris]|uniref:AcrR family transcriptional regulator n=2 Tax=Bifidobacterium castoris TaxID=2306972 RepID=A0A430F8W2_9BIFI|nr:AcrR family transcriptional regulator [Bifidobacterium castoris]